MGATNDGKAILEDFEEGKAHQLWKKGDLDAKDYFTLENSGVLTAISESSLEIKGNSLWEEKWSRPNILLQNAKQLHKFRKDFQKI